MKKILFLLLLCCGLPVVAQEVTDANTPLHLLKPEYGFHYGVPELSSVKGDIDRVLNYLEVAMPSGTENGRLKAGSFRLTSYESGVLYRAAESAALRTSDARYMRFVTDRLDCLAALSRTISENQLRNGDYDSQMRLMMLPNALDDAGAMCSAYCCLAITKGERLANPSEPVYDDIIKRYMNQIWRQYRIGEDHVFARVRPHYNTVWLDDMYMGIPALAWYGCLHNDTSSLHEAVDQIRAFKRRMWVESAGLFRHGWVEDMEPHPFFPWGRANGWALLTMCEVLDAMDTYLSANNGSVNGKKYGWYDEDRRFVLDLLRRHIEGLCALQDKSGRWRQLLNDPTSYLETSASAIYCYCMAHAICEGWIDVLAYGAQTLLAWNSVSTQINEKGQVMNTCVGSGMGFDRAFYCHRPVHVMAAHGYGPVIWAGGEIIRMLKQTHPKMNDSALQFYRKEQKTKEPIFSEER